MLRLVRTDSDNADFQELVALLDRYLQVHLRVEFDFYAPFNTLEKISHAVVAYDGHEPVGCGAFQEQAADLVEIKRMFVQPTRRGQGAAQEILAELERWASGLGYTTCVLETGKKLSAAIQLYQKNGYALVPNYGPYTGFESIVCMRKPLGA